MDLSSINKITILGFARTAVSAIEFLVSKGFKIKVSELKARDKFDQDLVSRFEKADVEFQFGEQTLDFIQDSDFVMVSPGVPPKAQIIQEIFKSGINYGTDIDLFLNFYTGDYIAVTGSNGKTTVTSLIAYILKTKPYGNVGLPVFEYFAEANQNIPMVMELSSAQLYYSQHMRSPQVAVYLNFAPDHLDWHSSLDEYRECKEKLLLLQNENAISILNFDDELVRKISTKLKSEIRFFTVNQDMSVQSRLFSFLQENIIKLNKEGQESILANTEDLNLLGQHNYSNVLAASLAADAIEIPLTQISERIKTFKPVEHRMEYVTTIKGKKFYNDSKATNPESAIKSVESFDKSIVIVGGKEKNLDLNGFAQALASRAHKVIALGEIKYRIKELLESMGYANILIVEDLEEAVERALAVDEALPVLLAPGSSSFDMFVSYDKRGEIFKDIVLSRL